MKRTTKFVTSLFFVIVFSVLIVECFAQTTVVEFDPNIIELTESQVGQSFTINLTVSDVSNLNAWKTKLQWDSSVLNLTSAKKGAFLGASGSTTIFIWPSDDPSIANGLTEINEAIFGYESVEGSGILAILNFTVLKVGQTAIGFADTELVTGEGRLPLDFTSSNGTITILATETTEPETTEPETTEPETTEPETTEPETTKDAGLPLEIYFIVVAGVVLAAVLVIAAILQRKKQ